MNCQQKIKIYTLKECFYCNLTKELLKKHNIKYIEINIEKKYKLLKLLKKKTGYNFVPQIFIQKKFIGGYTELKNMITCKK